MSTSFVQPAAARSAALLVSCALAVLSVACQEQPGTAVQAGAPAIPTPAPAIAASPPQAGAPATSVVQPSAPRRLPLGVQGVAPAGVTVRVKSIVVGGDATVLDVSISFANRITDSTMLALADTFLEDENGARLHIKRPEDNRDLTIREGQTLDGQLVFLGSVSVAAQRVRLVFNEGNDGDNIVAPGLAMELPLS